MRKELNRAPKELAGRFYQLMSGHAATAEHLKRVGQADSDTCFWCGSGERQTRHHLFVRCRRWTPEIRKLWQTVRAVFGAIGGPRPSVDGLVSVYGLAIAGHPRMAWPSPLKPKLSE